MAIVLSGNPSHITSPLVAQVTTIGNNGSGAIRVYTATPHQFGPGDSVRVYAGSGADGVFVANIITSTQFDLAGSTYVGGSGEAGFAYDQSLTPPILFPTDGDTFSQQLSGALSGVQALCDRTQYLQQQQSASSQKLLNWNSAFLATSISSGFVAQGACWNSAGLAWGVVGQGGGGDLLAFFSPGADNGNSTFWSQMSFHAGPATSSGAAITGDPSGNFWVASIDGSGNLTVQEAGAGSTARIVATASGQNPAILTFNGRLIYTVAEFGAGVISSALLSAPTVWTDFNIASVTAGEWLLRTGGAIAVAMPYSVSVVGTPSYYTSPDGVTWTARSLSTLLPNSAYTVQGLCYSPGTSTWYATVSTAGAGTPALVFSTNTPAVPASWTQLQPAVLTMFPADLAALGPYLFSTQTDLSSGGVSLASLSVNSGYTWWLAPQQFPTNKANNSTPYTRSRVAQGDYGLLAFNNLWARFSHNYGLPLTHL